MKTWIENFKPAMVKFAHPFPGDEAAIVVLPVIADRVKLVKHRIAIKKLSTGFLF